MTLVSIGNTACGYARTHFHLSNRASVYVGNKTEIYFVLEKGPVYWIWALGIFGSVCRIWMVCVDKSRRASWTCVFLMVLTCANISALLSYASKSVPDLLSSLTEQKLAPSFTRRPPESLTDSEGKTVKIEARLSGSQPLAVSWYKDNSEICSSDTYDMSFVNNLAVLCLRNSSRSQSGVYTCSASNEAGKASCLVSVTISGMMRHITSAKAHFWLMLMFSQASLPATMWCL